jgi:hypothetical protein
LGNKQINKIIMKKILLSIAAVSFSFGLSAQFYSEDFEGVTVPALPSGWTQVTVATDGGYKTSTDMTSTYFAFPAHTQYVGTNDDDCNCDKANEELISDPITLSSGSYVMSFEYVLGSYYGETAEVGISVGGTYTQLGIVPPTNGTGSHVWTNASFDISSYAGQTVNIVWIYHDNNDWGSGLMVDDVVISQPAAVDMEMTALTVAPTVAAGATSITGTVTSNSANSITSIDVSWNDGSGANSETFSVNMSYGDTYDFTHGTPLNTTGGQTYSVDVTVSAAGDADASNDMLSTSISAVSSVVPRVVVGEEKTGEWCGWCPRGAVALAEMALSNPDDFIGIAVHNGDGMTVSSYDGFIGAYIPGGYPGGGVDRVIEGDPSSFATMYNARKTHVAPASVSATGTYDANTISVDITADFVGSLSGDYRLAAILIADSVVGQGQGNYYSGGGSGPMAMPNGGSMANYDFAGGPQTINPYYHDHVAIALGDNEINGVSGSLPSSVSDGDSESYTYTFPRNANYNMGKVHVVGMLVNGSTGEILNAAKGNLTSTAVGVAEIASSSFNVNVYPNPTNGVSNLLVKLEEAGSISINVVNILGETVYNLESNKSNAGYYSTTVDLSNQPNGIYLAYVTLNGKQKSVRINLTK